MNKSELVQMVSQKSGISAQQAEKAVDVVISQLQSHLPGPVASQITNFLGEGGTTSQAGGLADKLGGMLGRKP